MRKRIQMIVLCLLLGSFFVPVNASGTAERGVLIPNDETGIVDPNLYEQILQITKQEQLYSDDLLNIEELTITNYEYDITSIQGLRQLRMPKLKILNIAVDTLESINDILVFTSLEELNLYEVVIKELPSNINQLANLKSLHIEGGNIASLPNSMFDIITLQSLVLKDIPLQKLSTQIHKLMYLETLVLDGLVLPEIPKEIYSLNTLKHLELNGMGLTSIASQMEDLQRLDTLKLEDNAFTQLPEPLFDLLNLQYLSLRNNKISTIPPQIQAVYRLRELDLSTNQLRTLPLEMINLSLLKTLDLANNDWDCLPSEFEYLSLTGVTNVFDHYDIKVCGIVDTTPATTIKAPLITLRDTVENGGRTNLDVIVECDQPVNFVVNDVAAMSRDQALAFSLEGSYKVVGTNQFGIASNTVTFTIDKTKPIIRITDNANDLGIYYIDVAIDANEDGYYIVNGVRQTDSSRLLLLSNHQAYTISFVDLAGNQSNELDFVLEAKTDETTAEPEDNRLMMLAMLVVFALVMGGATYLFLKNGMATDEDQDPS